MLKDGARNNQLDSEHLSLSTGSNIGVNIIPKIESGNAKIGVVGLGQVGLPTALSFLRIGYSVIGYDTNYHLVEDLSKGITIIPENGIKSLLVEGLTTGKILFESSIHLLVDADVIIVCVPTPLDSELHADLAFLNKALVEIAARCMESQKLIVVESSIPPKTMSTLVLPTLQKSASKKLGIDFLLAFCPERLSPGQALYEISDSDRIIGTSDGQSFEAAKALYSRLTNANVISSNFETVEVSKLAENAFRDVNIAFANELAMVCRGYGVDVRQVINIANTHPRVNILTPGPGVGGPCLPKDPYLLISKANLPSQSLIKHARILNDSMPAYLINLLDSKLASIPESQSKGSVQIGVLGVTYKPDVNDYQNSPAERIISELRRAGYQDITVHDPVCDESFGMKKSTDLKSLVKKSDCVIISTGHGIYESLSPYDFKKSCVIMDAARVLKTTNFIGSGHVYYMAPGLEI